MFAIWTNNRCGIECQPVVNLNEGGSLILLIRRANRIEVQDLSPHLFALLRAFAAGATVRAGVDSVIKVMGEFDLVDALGRLIGLGALLGLKSTAKRDPRVI